MALNDLNVRLGLITRDFNNSLRNTNRDLKNFQRNVNRIGRDLTRSLTLPIVAAGGAAVRTFAQFDRLEKGLAAIAGDAGAAKAQFDQLVDVVRDTRTTLDLRGAVSTQLQLQAVGVEAERVTELIKQLGIAATVSGSSADDIGEVGRQLAQAAAKGQILQQELRIILERIPALGAIIKEEFGTVTAEGLRDAGVSADKFITRLTKAIEANEKFQSVQGGLAKEFETFILNLQLAGSELGGVINNALGLEQALGKVSDFLFATIEGFKGLNEGTQRFLVILAGIVAAIGPLLLLLGAIGPTLATIKAGVVLVTGALSLLVPAVSTAGPLVLGFSVSLTALLGPLAIIAAAIGAVALVTRFYNDKNIEARAGLEAVARVNEQVNQKLETQKRRTEELLSVLRKEDTAQGKREAAFKELQALYPDYLENLSLEKDGYEAIAKAARLAATEQARLKQQEVISALKEQEKVIGRLNRELERLGEAPRQLLSTGQGFQVVDQQTAAIDKANDQLRIAVAERDALLGELATPGPTSPLVIGGGSGPGGGGVAPVDQGGPTTIGLLEQAANRLAPSLSLVNFEIEKLNRTTLKELPETIGPVQAAIERYNEANALAAERAAVFGDTQIALQEQLTNTGDLINNLVNAGFTEQSDVIQALKEKYDTLADSIKAAEEATKANNDGLADLSRFALQAGQAIGVLFGSVIANDKKATLAAIQNIGRLLAARAREAVIGAVTKTLASVPFPLNIALATAAGFAAEALINRLLAKIINIPGLAEGGIVTGPTLALIGEGSEAEAVIPLSKLEQFITGQGREIVVSGTLIGDGDQLIGVITRAEERSV